MSVILDNKAGWDNNMVKTKKIKMGDYLTSGSSIYSGRDCGVNARRLSHLDEIEQECDEIVFLFPENTWGINPSFYGGLLEESVRKAKNCTDFLEKYKFLYYDEKESNDSLKTDLQEDLQYVLNSIEG